MIRVRCTAIIAENPEGEILMLLRDDKPDISFPNSWTLVGGGVEEGETPEAAAHRELFEETGVDTELSFWKRYDRQHPNVIVDQHVYLGKIEIPIEFLRLGEGRAFRFFKAQEIKSLKIGFEFDSLLDEYFLNRKRI